MTERETVNDNHIWERLDTDTDKSFQAFCIYRDMGSNRSLRKVAKKLSKSETLINRWSMNHKWNDRTSEYDTYQAEQSRIRKENARAEIEADALADYAVIRKAIAKRIQVLEAANYQGSPSDLHELINLMEHANSYARLNSGLPDKITESSTKSKVDATVQKKPVSADDLSDDELAAILLSQQRKSD